MYPDDDYTSLATKAYTLIETLRQERASYNRIHIILEGYQQGLDEKKFLNSLIEDASETMQGQEKLGEEYDRMSYVDFLCYVHRQIQDKFL